MTELYTERLIIRTNCYVVKGDFTFPDSPTRGRINLLEITETKAEDVGFAIYLKTEEYIGHIGITMKRERFELTIGIDDDKYKGNRYMTEALKPTIEWIFKNSNVDRIWGLNGKISPEIVRKLLTNLGFTEAPEGKEDWWYIERSVFDC